MRTHIEKKTQIEAIRVAQTISNSAVDWTNSSVNYDMVCDYSEKTIESVQRQVVCLPDGGYIITGQVSSHILLLKYGADKEVSYEQGDKEVDFEQLFANPEAYNGRDITIEGFYFQGWEVITLREGLEYFNGHMNGSGRSMWIDGGVPREIYDEAYEQQVASQLQRYAKVRIKGMFEYGSRYGHCGGWSANIVPSEVVLLPWSPQVE